MKKQIAFLIVFLTSGLYAGVYGQNENMRDAQGRMNFKQDTAVQMQTINFMDVSVTTIIHRDVCGCGIKGVIVLMPAQSKQNDVSNLFDPYFKPRRTTLNTELNSRLNMQPI